MPIAHRYDNGSGFHRLTVTGVVTLDEFTEAMEKLVDPAGGYPPDRGSLWDLRGLDFENVDGDYWRSVVSVRKRYPQRAEARLAHVVADDLGYGMLRMYEIMSGLDGPELRQTVMIFRDMDAAQRWLREESRPAR